MDSFFNSVLNGEKPIITPRYDKDMLGSKDPGKTIWIPGLTSVESGFIVLEHMFESTLLITHGPYCNRRFDGRNSNYETSRIRGWLNNGGFYEELLHVVPSAAIKKHAVDLTADDGTGKDNVVYDYVSLLTTELYRKYRGLLKPIGLWWWTATRATYFSDTTLNGEVKIVRDDGSIGSYESDTDYGVVRPVCLLDSSLIVADDKSF